MGVAALVLGIVSLVFGFVPFCNIFALVPAIVGLVLGIIDWVKKSKENNPKGKAIAGTICSAISIVIIIVYYFAFVAVAAKVADGTKEAIENYDWNKVNFTVTTSNDLDF